MSLPAAMPDSLAQSLATDSRGLDALRLQAQKAPDQALKQAAKQFETVFLNMMLKSMRDATPQDGPFDSEQTRMFTSMLDQQLAQGIGERGVGLADIMVRQLSRNLPASKAADATNNNAVPAASPSVAPTRATAGNLPTPAVAAAPAAAVSPAKRALPSAYSENFQQDFVQRMLPYAQQASRETGIPAHLLLGQAALESGWGQRTIRNADGSDSYNLFGIKAGRGWKGDVTAVKTTEYHQGVASKPVEKFRAYPGYAEAFRDYANLLSNNERYADVIKQGGNVAGFAQAIQDAGYATDPHYADKLAKVIQRARALV